jgi:signal transduction histidine kinase
MFFLPGLRGLVRSFEHRKHASGKASALLEAASSREGQVADRLVRIAAALRIDVLALIEPAPDGKSARITAASSSGLACDLGLPVLEDKGLLSRLILRGETHAGRAKVFATAEVFPREGTWCDFIPMDSAVAYAFVPLVAAPANLPRHHRPEACVLAVDVEAPDAEEALELRAHAAASLVRLTSGSHRADDDSGLVRALESFLRSKGYSWLLLDSQGVVLRAAGETCCNLGEDTLEVIRQSLAALEGFTADAQMQGSTFEVSDDLKGVLYPMQSAGSISFLLVLESKGKTLDDSLRRELLKMLGRFTSSIAHEIKNPLTGIAAGVQYISKRLQPGVTEADTVDFILTEITRLNRIVDDLYMIARPPQLVLKETSVNDIIAKCLFGLSEDIVRKRIRLEQSLAKDVPTMNVDAERLQQVLINVLKNAIEASPENGVIEITTRREEDWVIVAVKDSGPGVPAAERERIFEPFYSTKKGGTGLGLCISQAIIDEHNGRMTVETPRDGGACFVIELPIPTQ